MTQHKYEKLTPDKEEETFIMTGKDKLPIEQMEKEMKNPHSDIGKKLREAEKELDKY